MHSPSVPESASGRGPEAANLADVSETLARVLVVEDNDVIRDLITVNLELEGFEVHTAIDGHECLRRASEVGPDVVTLDIMMPDLDGWIAASRLREVEETQAVKIVLITARAQDDDLRRGRELGVDAYLTKPFDPTQLVRVVRDLAGVG